MKFEKGDMAVVMYENGLSEHSDTYDIGSHRMHPGTEVLLSRYDPADKSWYCIAQLDGPVGSRRTEAWIFEDCLQRVDLVSEEEEKAAVNSITAGLHPDVIEMLRVEQEAREQGYTDGDVNHILQPLIGWLRLEASKGQTPDARMTQELIDKMWKACLAERAFLLKRQEEA